MNRKDRRAADKGATPAKPAGETDRLFALALQSHQGGRLSDAEGMYRHILSVNPRHADAQHLLGVLALQSGRAQVAVDMIGKAIALNSRAPSFHSNIAEALRMLGRFDDASAHLEKALALDPRSVEAHLTLGNVRKLQGRLDEAITCYRAALKTKPDYGEAHLNLGVSLMDRGELAEATAHLRQALKLRPRAPEAYANLAIALAAARQWSDAVAHYRQSLTLRPNHPETVVNLANALLGAGSVEDAFAHYEHAMRLAAHRAGNQDTDLSPIDGLWMALQGKRGIYPVEENGLISYVRVACLRAPAREWRAICDRAAKVDGLSAEARFELFVRRAISQWVGRDSRVTRTLEDAAALFATIPEPISKNVRNSRGYAEFLGALDAHIRADPAVRPLSEALPELAVIGDSHCLSYDGVDVTVEGVRHGAVARLVMGAKAFHLGEQDGNQYKWLFAKTVTAIEPGSPVVLAFGEIDCRLDEGILPFHRKGGGDLDAIVREQAERYVAAVENVTKPRGLTLHFLAVPAPHLDALARRHPGLVGEGDRVTLVRIIKNFNAAVEAAAVRGGHRFLDVYAIAAGPDGCASGQAHVDDYHLKPEVLTQVMG